ncbi:hypothetical protein BDU57DRAFT_574674, partial [Ampelomyces quisqualis]
HHQHAPPRRARGTKQNQSPRNHPRKKNISLPPTTRPRMRHQQNTLPPHPP